MKIFILTKRMRFTVIFIYKNIFNFSQILHNVGLNNSHITKKNYFKKYNIPRPMLKKDLFYNVSK